MASQLHARRRPNTELDPEAGGSEGPELPGSPEKYHHPTGHHGAHRRRRRCRLSGLQTAILAVVAFLACGLGLGYLLLHHRHRRVILHIMKDPWAHGRGYLAGRSGFRHHFYNGPPRVVAVVLPSVVRPQGRFDRLRAIQDTWGQYARAVFVVHNASEFPGAAHAVWAPGRRPEDIYSFPQLLVLPDDIAVGQGLERLYYTMRAVHASLNPDFAFFVNDHTFVVPEHLCRYLEGRDPERDLYAGHALKESDVSVFNSGAAGYVLSRATLRRLIQKWDDRDPDCWQDPATARDWLQGNPGLVTVKCLAALKVRAFDTRAAGKWHRFHAFPLTRVVSGAVDDWYRRKRTGMAQFDGFDASYETLLVGEDCCSRDTVSFHYVEAKEARALFATRELLLGHPLVTDQELQSYMLREWPSAFAELGGYSRGLPEKDREEDWRQLLAVVRKISTRATQREC